MKKLLLFILILIQGGILLGCSSSGGQADNAQDDIMVPEVQDGDGDFGVQSVEESKNIVACLNDAGATMYGTSRCGYCKKQKDALGASAKNIAYIDCDVDPAACAAVGVSGFPTWFIDGVQYPGYKTVSELSTIVGCSL